MNKALFFFFLLLFSFFSVFAEESFITHLDIQIDETGLVTFDGEGNYGPYRDSFSSQDYTSKEGRYWIFNFSSPVNFSYYSYELTLPKGARVNYLNIPKHSTLFGDDTIKILGDSEDNEINLLVQYSIEDVQGGFSWRNASFFLILGMGLLLLSLLIFMFMRKEKKKKKKEKKVSIEIEDFSLFPKRQQDILELLQKHGKLSQKELEEKIKIPKSSLSRNIQSLKVKGYIEVKSIGVTNYISLKKKE